MKKEQTTVGVATTIEPKPSVDAAVENPETGLARLSDINPKKTQAFSPNLYLWLRKNRLMRKLADRYDVDGVEYLGFLDEGGFLIGSKLWAVLCKGSAEKVWAFPAMSKVAIRRPLWEDYLNRGRCAIDPAHEMHFLGDRFSITGDTRVCQWCGCIQQRETYEVVTTRERWATQPAV